MSWVSVKSVNHFLRAHHYLGATMRGIAWHDEFGVIVLSSPTSRMLPQSWLELSRWCITSKVENAGSRQWSQMIRSLKHLRPNVTTIISYSDPSRGHTGSLYRACNWWWAPTWHRLRPPPTGNGSWSQGARRSVKDRWVFAIKKDSSRCEILRARDSSILSCHPEL